MSNEERDWRLEAPEDGGKIVANDSRKTIIAKPAGSPHNPNIISDFQYIMKSVKSYEATRELLKKVLDALDSMDEGLNPGGSPHNDNGWNDQDAHELYTEIQEYLKEN